MSSTTNEAEQSSKSGGPQGCVDRSRSAASSILCDICRFGVLPCISATLNTTGTWRFEDAFYMHSLFVGPALFILPIWFGGRIYSLLKALRQSGWVCRFIVGKPELDAD